MKIYPRVELRPEHCGYFHNNQNGPILIRRAVKTEDGIYGTVFYLGKTISVEKCASSYFEYWRTYKNERKELAI